MSRLPLGCAALAALICFSTSPVLADWKEDHAKLASGVVALEMGGSAGGVALAGRLAFPLAQSAQRQVVVGCGYNGDRPEGGRVVGLAHTSFVSAASPAMRQWLANLAVWSGRAPRPELLVLAGSTKEWTAAGVRAVEAPKQWSASALQKAGCVYINLHALSPELARTVLPDLERFSQAGGGLIFASTPWAAKPELLEFASRLMHPAGIAFLSSGPSDTRYPLAPLPSPYASALRALDALLAEQDGKTPLPLAERQTAAAALEGCIAADFVPQVLEQALVGLHDKRGWTQFSAEKPMRRNLQPVEALMARFEGWWLRRQPPDKTPAHPLAADYPGLPAPGPEERRELVFNANTGPDKFINHGDRTRIATGLYARPGVPVRVTLPKAAVSAGLKVELGIHVDRNWNLASWRRFPEISTLTPLAQEVTSAANAFGGLVSILVPAGCGLGEVRAIIEGAVAAPVFTLGKTQAGDWKTASAAPGAWGYLETSLWTGYFSREQLRAMEEPARIAGYWHSAVETADQLLGYAPWRKRGESMLVDRDIYVGYGHAGYPVMMMYGAEKGDGPDALLGRGPRQGDWGFLHELGHTFQDSFDGNYTIATHGEVDVNLVPALVLQRLHGRVSYDNNSHGTFDAKSRLADWEKWKALPAGEQTWAKACKMNVAYDFYFTLAECHGWELYSRAFGRLMKWLQKPGEDPALDAISEKAPSAKRDRFFVCFCEESGFNLLPFFEKYGLGRGEFKLGEAVRARVAKLPVWEGNRPMEGVAGPAEVVVPAGASEGAALATFQGKDPDPGTVFRYRVVEGNGDEVFELDAHTGVLNLRGKGRHPARTVVVEAQDNCIPLSSARAACRVTFP
jgi:hypothetical protein